MFDLDASYEMQQEERAVSISETGMAARQRDSGDSSAYKMIVASLWVYGARKTSVLNGSGLLPQRVYFERGLELLCLPFSI